MSVLTRPALPRPAAPVRRSLWRHRDFRLLFVGETASKLGGSISSVALPLVGITVLQAGALQVGLLTAASWLPWLLIGLPAGAWVDRLPRRPVMIVCNLASMLLLASVPVAALLGLLTMTQLLVTALLTGAASVFFQTAYQVFLPSLLTPEELPEGNAKLQGAESAAHVAGPGLAGAITQVVGVLGGLVADAASFLISTLCLLRIRSREAPSPRHAQASSLRREIGEGMRFVAGDPYLRIFAVFGAASNLALTGYQSVLLLFLVRDLSVSASAVGLLLMAGSLGGVIGAAAANRIARRFGTAHGFLLCLLVTSPFALLIPLAGSGGGLALVVLGVGALGLGVVAGNVIKGSFRQVYTPHRLLGRVTVTMHFVNFGAIPLGGLLGGLLGEHLGLRPTLWIMTGAVALAPLGLLLGPIRRRRDLPTAPPIR